MDKHKFQGTLPLTLNYSTKYREELAHMIAVEHLSFNFSETNDFIIIVKEH